ncbi:MAG TPA: hypothetical protein VNZ52_15105 [Candidatus Thermoplasmatota archaeon]|nr:hypothetical protein [Candidatus Thermoplasmatota archaeon]
MRRLAALLVPALLLTGCLAATEGEPEAVAREGPLPAASWEAVKAALAGVPCEAAVVGADTSENLKVLGLDPLDDYGAADHGEMAFHTKDNRTLAAVARYSAGGFDLVDVTDPLAPKHLMTWDPEDGDYGLDLKFTADGATLVLAGAEQIRLVDLRDPLAPRQESTFPLDAPQAHLLTVFPVDGVEYVAASKGENRDLSIFRIVGEPGNRTLERVARPALTPLGDTERNDLVRSHDTWFEVDPETGTPLLWVANVWWGILGLDVTDPANPKEVTRMANLDPFQGYVHSVQVTHLEGRRLVVSVQEYGTGALKVYDATDLKAPHLVALWNLDIPTMPQHNLQVVGQYAYVAHFADGLFVFDLTQAGNGPAPTRLSPVAHLAPEGDPPLDAFRYSMFAQYFGPRDVVIRDGILWVSETTMGLRTVGFGCLTPGDVAQRSSG